MIKKIILWVCNLFDACDRMSGTESLPIGCNSNGEYGKIAMVKLPFVGLPKQEIGPDYSITRERLTAKEINERYPGAIIGNSGYATFNKEIQDHIDRNDILYYFTETPEEYEKITVKNANTVIKWIREKEEREIIDHLLKFDRETLVRLNEYISNALTQTKEA
jgi:hypothetical protein